MSGWIKLHRKIQEHWVFSFDEPDKTLAFIDIVLSASYADNAVMIKGRTYHVKRGQFLASQTTLQRRWKWSQNKVSRFLNLLKKEGVIDLQTDERTSIISVCNYSEYQSSERADESANERAVERASNEQSNDTIRNKELKKKRRVSKSADFEPSGKQTFSEKCFEVFWKEVEKRGTGKPDALKAFEKYTAGKTDDEIEYILNVVCHWYELYLMEDETRLLPENKKYLKSAAAWLNSAPWRVDPQAYAEFKRNYYGVSDESKSTN